MHEGGPERSEDPEQPIESSSCVAAVCLPSGKQVASNNQLVQERKAPLCQEEDR